MIDLTKTQIFSRTIMEMVENDSNVSYIDAVVSLCEKNNMEIEQGVKLLNSIVKEKIEQEAIATNNLN